jgi:hypothetical protein
MKISRTKSDAHCYASTMAKCASVYNCSLANVSDISRQAKRVNSGVRPTVLYRETETGERRASSIETIGVFVAISIPDRRDQIMARDIAGSFARELIGLLDNFAVGLEK